MGEVIHLGPPAPTVPNSWDEIAERRSRRFADLAIRVQAMRESGETESLIAVYERAARDEIERSEELAKSLFTIAESDGVA